LFILTAWHTAMLRLELCPPSYEDHMWQLICDNLITQNIITFFFI
jgi:hypothetical protein